MHPPFGRSLLGAFWTVVFAGLRGEERARRFLDMAIQGGLRVNGFRSRPSPLDIASILSMIMEQREASPLCFLALQGGMFKCHHSPFGCQRCCGINNVNSPILFSFLPGTVQGRYFEG